MVGINSLFPAPQPCKTVVLAPILDETCLNSQLVNAEVAGIGGVRAPVTPAQAFWSPGHNSALRLLHTTLLGSRWGFNNHTFCARYWAPFSKIDRKVTVCQSSSAMMGVDVLGESVCLERP